MNGWKDVLVLSKILQVSVMDTFEKCPIYNSKIDNGRWNFLPLYLLVLHINQPFKTKHILGSKNKDKNLPTRLSRHSFHVVFGHIDGLHVLWIQDTEHCQGTQVVAINFVPSSTEVLGIPGRKVLKGTG